MRGARLLPLLLVAALLAGCAAPANEPVGEGPAADADAGDASLGPAWSFTATDGATYGRDAPEGNATVLFFMATWCGSCRGKAPVVAAVANEYADRGVRTYSLDFDPSETAEDLRAWQERYQQPWPHGTDPSRAVQRAFDVRTQSTVLVLDADGQVVRHFGYGQVTERELRDAVDSVLA